MKYSLIFIDLGPETLHQINTFPVDDKICGFLKLSIFVKRSNLRSTEISNLQKKFYWSGIMNFMNWRRDACHIVYEFLIPVRESSMDSRLIEKIEQLMKDSFPNDLLVETIDALAQ